MKYALASFVPEGHTVQKIRVSRVADGEVDVLPLGAPKRVEEGEDGVFLGTALRGNVLGREEDGLNWAHSVYFRPETHEWWTERLEVTV